MHLGIRSKNVMIVELKVKDVELVDVLKSVLQGSSGICLLRVLCVVPVSERSCVHVYRFICFCSVPKFTNVPDETMNKIADVLEEVKRNFGSYLILSGWSRIFLASMESNPNPNNSNSILKSRKI